MNRREAVTSSDLGPVVSLVTWIVEASVILAVVIKFTLSSTIPGRRSRDDIALFFATAFSVGFTVAISVAVSNGVGKHQETLPLHQLESLQMAVYVAGIFFILVSSCAQASVILCLYDVTPSNSHRRFIKGIMLSLALIFLSSIFVAACPCRPPHVWKLFDSQCIDHLSFWEAYAGLSIAIECALIVLPIFIIYYLRVGVKRKAILIGCFAARLLVIGPFATQIYEAQSLKSHLVDRTFYSWTYFLAIVFVQGLSIITVCIPYIRNVLLRMESGMIQTGHLGLLNDHSITNEGSSFHSDLTRTLNHPPVV
ncbi:hypothetical protein F4777DRAFT_590240 [Nemania sp. FL0916]|nr:hypothetical protein F4777DRAFT_590240 [Nemania sp. FL0916]